MKTTLLIYLGIYILAVIGMSWFISRKKDDEGFLIANRNRSWWMISLSKFAGAIGVGYFITYTGYAYEYGMSVVLVIIGSVIGYLFFALWAIPRIYRFSRQQQFYTQGDFVSHTLKNKYAGKLTNHLGNVILFGWLLIGVIGGAKIINHFGLLSYELALILTVVVVVVYIVFAGFKAVLATDVLQSIIILSFVSILAWIIMQGVGFSEIISVTTSGIDSITAVSFFIFGTLTVFSHANWYQLVYSAKDTHSARKGISMAVIPILVVALLLLLIGMYMFVQDPHLDSGLVFLEALNNYVPSYLLPIGIILFFAGLMSSADTNTYAVASHYVLSGDSQNPIADIRKTTVVIGILSIIIAYFFRDIIDVTIFVAAISILLSLPMIYLVAGGKNKYQFFGSIIGGIVGVFVGFLIFGIEPAMGIPVFVLSLFGLLYKGWGMRRYNL